MSLGAIRMVARLALVAFLFSCTGQGSAALTTAEPASLVTSFASGSLIIPQGTNYQAAGALRSYGLVYALLRAGVPVQWAVLTGKPGPTGTVAATDFTIVAPATIRNRESGAAVAVPATYRGSAFIVSSDNRAAALPIIDAWLAADTLTVVHDVTGAFSADVARSLTAAPRIAVFADGNEDIAFTDLNAAGIPDSAGNAWAATSPDLLTPAQVAGATTTSHTDGALLRADGTPAYCHITSMHWAPAGTDPVGEVVSEVRAWLDSSRITHAFMECQAAATFENDPNGRFLTTGGLNNGTEPIVTLPLTVNVPDAPFAQYDGPLAPDTGNVQSILPTGGAGNFRPFVRRLISGAGGEVLWASTRLAGDTTNGQLTYLAGHDYSVATPISGANNQTNGVRLILDSLFESDCASAVGQANVAVMASAPATSASRTFTITLSYTNTGAGAADGAVLTAALPAGATLGATTGGGVLMGTNVVWNLGNLAPGASASVTYTITVPADGTYMDSARMTFRDGLTPRTVNSNVATTVVTSVIDTTIVTAEPSPTNDPTGDFTFSSTDPAATFECSIDGGAFAACAATFSTTALADGMHTLAVRSRNATLVDATPATATWIVDTTAPDTTIVTAEPSPTSDPTGDFVFSSPDATATFRCSIDGGAFAACPATFSTASLPDGMHTIAVAAVDAAGNVDATPAMASWVVDTSTTVAITAPVSGSTVMTATPPITGTGEPGATVSVSVDGTVIGTATVSAAGTWSVTATPLANGAHTAVATATDGAGNTAMATTMFTVMAGTFVVIDAPADGSSIRTRMAAITGHGTAGDTVTVMLDGTTVGMTTVAADGTWSITPTTPLADGMHTVVANAQNARGDMATDTNHFTVDGATVVDFLQPGDHGSIGDTTPELSGTAEAGDSVQVTVDGTVLATVTADAEGNWTLQLTTPLANGMHMVSVLATDAAGNTATDTGSFTLDTTFPALEIRTPADGSHTSDTRPEISGDTTPGLLVIVILDGVMIGTATADASGHWSLVPATALTAGTHTVRGEVTNAAGQTAVDQHGFTVDAAAPTIVITTPANGAHVADTTPTLSGTSQAGNVVQVFVDGTLVGTLMAAADGSWSIDQPTALAQGTHTVRAVATNAAGRTATDSGSFVIDTVTTVAIASPATGSTIGNVRPTIRGTAEPGDTVVVTLDGTVLGTVTAAADGTWSIPTTSDLTAGSHTATAHATDAAGNAADATSTFTYDAGVLDTDGDGIIDTNECPSMPCRDSDGDGMPDFMDPDDDNDGVPTALECIGGVSCMDTDTDGTPDYLDVDDDGDGVATMTEAPGGVLRDTDTDGRPDYLDVDDDGDGIPTAMECVGGTGCMDTDVDGHPDYVDPDDDDDTIPTARERADGMRFGNDVDGDGRPDWLDTDSDGAMGPDQMEGVTDSDGDGIPNYLDPSDGAVDAGVRDGGPGVDAGPRDAGPLGDGAVADAGAGPHAPGGFSGGACVCATPGATSTRSPVGALLGLVLLGLVIARRRRKAAAAAVVLAVLATTAPSQVEAQRGGFTLDQFRPAETAIDGFAISRPNDLGHLNFGAQLVLDYAHDPFVYEERLGDQSTQSRAVVENQLVGTVGLSLGLVDRVVIYGGLPVSLWNEGSGGPGFPAADGTQIGDPYLGVRVRLFGEAADTFALAIQLTGTAPLSNLVSQTEAFSGEQSFAFLPRLNGELRFLEGRLRIGMNLGARFRQQTQILNLTVGQELTYGLGVTGVVVPNLLDLTLEAFGATNFDHFFEREWTPFELLGGARVHPMCDLTIGAAIGGGLTRGYGSPNFRGVLSVGWAYDAACHTTAPLAEEEAPPVPGDADRDGILDEVDSCPTEPEDVDTFQDTDGCPDPDNDGDSVLDVNDGAPMEPEDPDGFQDPDGVPDPDNDQDAVLDVNDGAPLDPEDRDGFRDQDGVPDPDNDQDGVPDTSDECPTAPGTAEAHGCPRSVRLDEETGQIIILQRVEFATNRDVILERSYPILEEVRAVMQANPQLTTVRVEGHTDDRGRDDRNMDLSRRRAISVIRWLIEHGVAPSRLTGLGCGELHPIDSNATTDGRQSNRRVEFHIVAPAPPDGIAPLEGCVEARP